MSEILSKINSFLSEPIYLCFDISGSSDSKKMFYERIYRYYYRRYNNINIIEHSTVARFSTIEEVLTTHAGGTYMSTPLGLILNQIDDKNIHEKENIIIQCCDGDNWSEDNERFLEIVKKISEKNKYIYYEVLPSTYTTTMYSKIRKLKKENTSLNIEAYHVRDYKNLEIILQGGLN